MTQDVAGYHTVLHVLAKDGTWRDVAVCAEDTADVIGRLVIAAILGTELFQLSTSAWPDKPAHVRVAITCPLTHKEER